MKIKQFFRENLFEKPKLEERFSKECQFCYRPMRAKVEFYNDIYNRNGRLIKKRRYRVTGWRTHWDCVELG